MIERRALEDDQVDEDERRVLQRIFEHVTAETVADKVWREIESFKTKYNI